MIRSDKVTIYRENYELIEGEVVYSEPILLAENLPCHLSVILNNTYSLNGAPIITSDFTLFLNSNFKTKIKENDILQVTTSKNQEYKLFAGEIKIYDLSIQIKCRQEKIIES